MFDEADDAVRSMLRRVALKSINDSGTQQRADVSGMKGDAPRNLVRLQHAGLSSNPSAGAEGLMLSLGGRSDRGYALGLEHPQFRPTGLPSGGTALYDESGNIIKLIGQNVTFEFTDHSWSVTTKEMDITASKLDIYIRCKKDRTIYLGAPPDPSEVAVYGKVTTNLGDSINVKARVS